MKTFLTGLAIALTVLIAGPVPHATASAAQRPATNSKSSTWGHTSAADQRLTKGCHRYEYTYRVTAPSDAWMAEVFLEDRAGRGIAFRSFDSTADAAKDTRAWKLCTSVVHSGRYTLRMKITWEDVFRQQHEGWVDDTHFALKRVA